MYSLNFVVNKRFSAISGPVYNQHPSVIRNDREVDQDPNTDLPLR